MFLGSGKTACHGVVLSWVVIFGVVAVGRGVKRGGFSARFSLIDKSALRIINKSFEFWLTLVAE